MGGGQCDPTKKILFCIKVNNRLLGAQKPPHGLHMNLNKGSSSNIKIKYTIFPPSFLKPPHLLASPHHSSSRSSRSTNSLVPVLD